MYPKLKLNKLRTTERNERRSNSYQLASPKEGLLPSSHEKNFETHNDQLSINDSIISITLKVNKKYFIQLIQFKVQRANRKTRK